MFPYIEIASIKLSTFPFVILTALFATGIVYIKSPKYSKTFMLDLMRKVVPILVGAALGAKLTSAITLMPISDNPFWYNLLFGGSVFYGGIVGGCIGLAIVCFKNQQSFLEYTDVFVTLLPLGHAIGRIGCYLNGCCYGCAYSGFLSVKYPVNGEMIQVFPTWFIEASFCLMLFLFFQYICKTNIRGIRTALYFIVYSVYRFFIEYARGDEIRGVWGVITTSQIISIFILLFGVIVLVYSCKTKLSNYMITNIKENKTYAI